MPDIPLGGQPFDLAFHPTSSVIYTALLTGEIKAFGYDEQGQHEHKFTIRPSKRSCRALAMSEHGDTLWAAGKSKALYTLDSTTGTIVDTRLGAHDAPINRIKRLTSHLVSTGDDDGVIKLWDTRTPDSVARAYSHHTDFISDFLYLPDKKQLVATSGDGTLSVVDVRSNKPKPLAQSEDQEDELLSLAAIRGASKIIVGTQIGVLSVFNRSSGWGDCVDRIPGHPSSIDALCALPSRYPSAHSTLLTGSSDGLVRAVQLFPTALLGVVADHGAFPVERVLVDRAGEGEWVGSVGHEEVVKMTHLRDVFEDEDPEAEAEEGEKEEENEREQGGGEGVEEKEGEDSEDAGDGEEEEEEKDEDSSEEEEVLERKKRKRQEKDPLAAPGRKKKGRNEVDTDRSFFADL